MGQQGIRINTTVAQFERNMEKIAAHRKEYDTLCGGWEMLDASWVDRYLAIAHYILAGHEGLPLAQAAPIPLPNGWPTSPPPTNPEGRTVYIRHVPRGAGSTPPGQTPSGGQGQRPDAAPGRGAPDENMRRLTHGGCTVTYDVRKVRD
jgi:hypothetical protein